MDSFPIIKSENSFQWKNQFQMALEIVLGAAIQELSRVIEREREIDIRFEAILDDLKSTLEAASPRISEICQLRESNGLQNDELHRLSEQLAQAKETVEKCSRVAWWNFCKRRKYFKELLRLDASLRNFFRVNLPIDQYKNTTRLQVQLKDLAKRLDRIIIGKMNASRRSFNRSRYKVSDAAGELQRIVRSLPGWIFLYLGLVMRIPRWGYQRITKNF